MADTSDFRPGLNIVWKDGLWEIIDYLHVKPGKGGAFVRAKLKNVREGQVQDTTFRAGEKIETARVERRPHQFLYEDDFGLHFMNENTYKQFSLPPDQVDGREYIKEGGSVDILFYAENEEPLRTVLPAHIEAEVVQTDPGLRGDTATGATKPATIESGATVPVPLFISEGDVIRVSTSTGEYQERISMA